MTTSATSATAAAPAAATCSPEARVTKSLLGYGPLAGAVFVGSILVQGLTRHGFSIPHDDASLLANGPLGWIQVVTFLVAGAMTIARRIETGISALGLPHAIGVATVNCVAIRAATEVARLAEGALQRAKTAGEGRIVAAETSTRPE